MELNDHDRECLRVGRWMAEAITLLVRNKDHGNGPDTSTAFLDILGESGITRVCVAITVNDVNIRFAELMLREKGKP